MAEPAPSTPDPRSVQTDPTMVTFDPQGWTVVQPSSGLGSLGSGTQSKTGAPGALDDAVGTSLGPYEILGVIARGGQGVVYKARHRELGTAIALKLLLAHKDARSVQLFRQEAQVLARLRHPNVIVVTDLGEMVGVPFLAMDFVRGADLKSVVDVRGPLDLETARQTLATIARTLQFCHERGLVHRDVKPQNILIEEQTGRPILIDFGLIKRQEQFEKEFGAITTPLMISQEMGGTPSFMSPEQTGAPGFGPTGPHSDVYGLGATLYYVLTGKPPFVGAKTLQTLNMVMTEPPVDPRKHRPDIPEALARLCLQAMAKRPEERPKSAEAFAAVLVPRQAPEGDAAFYLARGAARRKDKDLAGALSDLARSAEMLAPGDPLEKRVEEERGGIEAELARRGGTRPLLKVGVALAILLLVGALAAALLRSPPPDVDLTDTTPPEVKLDPIPEWTGGPLTFRCTVSDQQPKSLRCQLVIDGKPAGTPFQVEVPRSGPVLAQLDPASVTSATISTLGIIAIAEDRAGNTGKDERAVPIMREPPRIAIQSPADLTFTSARTLDVSAHLGSERRRDAVAVLRVGETERARQPLELTVGDIFACTALPLPDEDGPCTLEVACSDLVGNKGAATVTLTVDRTPPELEVLAPLGEPAVREDAIPVRVRARDASREVKVSLEGQGSLEQDKKGDFVGTFHLTHEGRNEASVVARDKAGNETRATVAAVRDSTAPRLLEVTRLPGAAEVTSEQVLVVLVTDKACKATVGDVPARADAEGRRHVVSVPTRLGKNALAVVLTDARENSARLEPLELAFECVQPPLLRPAWWSIARPQREHALAKGIPVAFVNAQGMKFALIPPGTFRMGSPGNEPGRENDESAHEVVLTRGFYMGATEVTNAQFRRFQPGHDSGDYKGKGSLNGDDQPVVNVTLTDAYEFCRWLDKQAGKENLYRLPTEAEWEYACRAGTDGSFFWGAGPEGAARYANGAGLEAASIIPIEEKDAFPFRDEWPLTAPVGGRQPNPFGLFDMIGNAAEWVSDRHKSYRLEKAQDPMELNGDSAIARGGSFADGPARSRAAYRLALTDSRKTYVGFRVVAERAVEQR